MSNNTSAVKFEIKALGLVRDAHGNPQIDDYSTCPDEIKDLLTQEERERFENGTNSHNSSS